MSRHGDLPQAADFTGRIPRRADNSRTTVYGQRPCSHGDRNASGPPPAFYVPPWKNLAGQSSK